DYLSKPTTLDALKAKIEHWVTTGGNVTVENDPAETTAPAAAPASAPADAPLDSTTLNEFTGGDASLRREILLQFMASDEPDAAELRQALAGDDCATIAKTAHRVKGASRMIGAQPYANVAERIERAGREGDLAAAKGCIADFEREQARLAAYLHSETGEA
ncbi:MAG: sensor histidine kinase, partial [Betaproteobacteria bacterium]|nr:sensor histidine kinase [Betaproteobacteria bacterium]